MELTMSTASQRFPRTHSDRRQWPSGRFVLQPAGVCHRSLIHHGGVAAATALERLHTAVLLMVLPCTVFWCPLYISESRGTLTLLDCTLLTLWVTSLTLVFRSNVHASPVTRHCARVCIFAVLIECGYAIGSTIFGQTANLGQDLLRFMKIFGFPSIIPLSVCLASRVRGIHWMFIGSAFLAISFNVGVPFTGYQDTLPLFTRFADLSAAQVFRPTGAVSNPNDFGYISVAGLAFALAGMSRAKRSSTVVRLACLIAIVVSLFGVVTSGSRSAMVGVLCGATYYLIGRQSSIATKIRFGCAVLLFVACGWQFSEVFRERMDTAITEKVEEANFASRLDAQTVSIRTWAAWPLGVGSSNMPEATAPYANGSQWVVAVQGSDSIYVDILLGAGIGGLVCLLFCFGSCWKLASAASLGPSRVRLLRAAMLSMFCIGFASLAPATSFVAPFFFGIVGLATLPEDPGKTSLVS